MALVLAPEVVVETAPDLGLPEVAPGFHFVLHGGPIFQRLKPEEFYALCQANPDWQFECTATGDLLIMAPTGGESGQRNANITIHVGMWNLADSPGIIFDSSTLFLLPNGAKRSPDVSWVRRERWEALTPAQRELLPPLCPDFVIELCSRTDRLSVLQAKMQEYLDNGAQLSWLIDPYARQVYIYRPGQAPACLHDPVTLSGDPLLPGFMYAVRQLWA